MLSHTSFAHWALSSFFRSELSRMKLDRRFFAVFHWNSAVTLMCDNVNKCKCVATTPNAPCARKTVAVSTHRRDNSCKAVDRTPLGSFVIFAVFDSNNKMSAHEEPCRKKEKENLILYYYILIIRLLKLILSAVLPLYWTSPSRILPSLFFFSW